MKTKTKVRLFEPKLKLVRNNKDKLLARDLGCKHCENKEMSKLWLGIF